MGITYAIIASAVTAVATSLGAIPALFIHRVSQKTQDILIGFCAGIMLAACSFSLIIPALKIFTSEGNGRISAGLCVALGILFGAAFLYTCNRFVPDEHFFKSAHGGPSPLTLKRIWLFVFAITLHNFPEGLAVGSGAGSQNMDLALPILSGIALQDIPEGFVVAMALISARYTPLLAIGVAVMTGVVEAIAALLGYFATVQMQVLLPWSLAFAGGAMLYVISDEMIPESHTKGNSHFATMGLMVGFVVMMFLDTALG